MSRRRRDGICDFTAASPAARNWSVLPFSAVEERPWRALLVQGRPRLARMRWRVLSVRVLPFSRSDSDGPIALSCADGRANLIVAPTLRTPAADGTRQT